MNSELEPRSGTHLSPYLEMRISMGEIADAPIEFILKSMILKLILEEAKVSELFFILSLAQLITIYKLPVITNLMSLQFVCTQITL